MRGGRLKGVGVVRVSAMAELTEGRGRADESDAVARRVELLMDVTGEDKPHRAALDDLAEFAVVGLDVHKNTVMAAVRAPDGVGGRSEVVREFSTFTADLVRLGEWLAVERVTQVVMEATGVYWRPVWHVLEERGGHELMLVNARHVKNLPGRKTDVGDASWLAQLLECGLLRGSFVPTHEMARLRDLTRYRTKLTQERTREIQRVQKLLEDANIKLDSVITDVMGKSAREMLDALIAGETDVEAMAQMARTRMRPKIPELRLALEGRFNDHHRLMLRLHLRHIDDLCAMIVELDTTVDELMAPFDEAATRLLSIPGVGKRTAETIVAEIGVDMSRFPTAGHLASMGRVVSGEQRIGRQAPFREGPQGQRGAPHRDVRGGMGSVAYSRHIFGGAISAVQATDGNQERRQSHLRSRAHDDRDGLASPRRQHHLRRTRRRLLRQAQRR